MATEVAIPNLGYTMTKAKILKWIKSEGDPVQTGEVLLEIETDKVAYGIESPAGGILTVRLAKEGDELAVGAIVGIIANAEETLDVSKYTVITRPEPAISDSPCVTLQESAPSGSYLTKETVLVSPVAKKLAREKGLDLSLIKGSGRSGRIRLSDVELYLNRVSQAKPDRPEAINAISGRGLEIAEVIPMNTMRKAIARRLSQSFHDAPHFNLLAEIDMTEIKRLLSLHRKEAVAQTGTKISMNDVFIKAVAVTLSHHPRLNARQIEDRIEIIKSINVGLAVALDDGLIVPAIEKADQKRLWQIALERKDLVERAREGRLKLEEIERGTFTVSNLGMYDIVLFNSILNPPQSGILSIGKIMDRPIVSDNQVIIQPMVSMSLTVDHRIVDGAIGAQFLHDLKRGMENPYLLF